MDKIEKTEITSELKDRFSRAKVAIFADYKGLPAAEADELRKTLRPHQVEVKVLKNNLARLVTKDGVLGPDAKEVMDGLIGPTLVAFGFNDVAAVAKAIDKFSTDHEVLQLKTSLMGRKKISVEEVKTLAHLPPREVLLGQLLGVMNGPIRSFVTVLAAVPRGLVTALAAIEKKKQEAAAGGQS